MSLLIRRAELVALPHGTTRRMDVLVRNGQIADIAPRIETPIARQIDAGGSLLLPGLSDHHLHLFATAAALASVDCSPESNADEADLVERLRTTADTNTNNESELRWLRGTGYDDSLAGPLDRNRLDEWLPNRPLRVQHASGKMWFLNSAALTQLNVAALDDPGVERDPAGEPTGRLFRLDAWLRQALAASPPSLATVSARLTRFGVTQVTDATPSNDAHAAALFAARQASGELRQRLRLMGNEALPVIDSPRLGSGELKVLLDEAALPDLDALIARLRRAHKSDRRAAFHCVTPLETTFALAALDAAGALPGDRIEHASLLPPEQLEAIAERGVTVVTQPVFIHARGGRYRQSHGQEQWPQLYRTAGHLRLGTPLAFASDAPYGPLDPWLGMQAAVTRKTQAGETLGVEEAVSPEAALAAYLGAADEPGRPRELKIGATADLCLLNQPWRVARANLSADLVRAVYIDGEQIV